MGKYKIRLKVTISINYNEKRIQLICYINFMRKKYN